MKNFIKELMLALLDFIENRRTITSIEKSQKRIAFRDSQTFIYENSSLRTLSFSDHISLREHCIRNAPETGLLLEFGVYKGKSVNFMASVLDCMGDERSLYGFDSFAGFSEEWSGVDGQYSKKHFDQAGSLPVVDGRVKLIPGFIECTLSPFLEEMSDHKVAFIHIDTDTYTPAKVALSLLKQRFQSGTIVLFDEYCGYPNWRSHEHAALKEVVDRAGYEFIGFAQSDSSANLIKAAIRIH
ncbi:class I SAM-dependent methyltransferase [Luminiphilus sp.]|nr:class I SAM-dependent methyltransferase [Luminiphilus sp.]